jgi:hypothetical protein
MTNDKTALDFFTSLAYGCVSEYAIRGRYGHALYLHGNALGRFGQIAGWIVGLAHAGKAEFAAKAAEDFDTALKGALAGYSDEVDMEVRHDGLSGDNVEGVVRAPGFSLVLMDDATFGGFGLAYYRAVSNYERLATARSLDEEAYSSGDLPRDEAHQRWMLALEKAGRKLMLNKELEVMRYYTPSWANDETPSYMRNTGVPVHYGYYRNGGLLYHGPGGGEVFAVTLGAGGLWRTHS